jgi:hypothetical protein
MAGRRASDHGPKFGRREHVTEHKHVDLRGRLIALVEKVLLEHAIVVPGVRNEATP